MTSDDLKRIHLCIDIDNVIGHTDEVMRQVICDYTDGRVSLEYTQVCEFNYYHCSDGNGNAITADEWTKIHELFSEPKYLWQIRPVDGMLKALQELGELGQLHIATTRLQKARGTTVEWLESLGLPQHNLHFLRHGEKHSSLRSFDVAVEDDYEQALSFANMPSTKAILLAHPWNFKKPSAENIQWAKSWQEITDKVKAIAFDILKPTSYCA
jgi:uncharacterized HAD superfamily protein